MSGCTRSSRRVTSCKTVLLFFQRSYVNNVGRDFAAKWGSVAAAPRDTCVSCEIFMVIHAVVLFMILVLVRPSFVSNQRDPMRVTGVHLGKALVTSGALAILTHFIPLSKPIRSFSSIPRIMEFIRIA